MIFYISDTFREVSATVKCMVRDRNAENTKNRIYVVNILLTQSLPNKKVVELLLSAGSLPSKHCIEALNQLALVQSHISVSRKSFLDPMVVDLIRKQDKSRQNSCKDFDFTCVVHLI